MPNAAGEPQRNPFDIRLIRRLVGLMQQNDLSEIALKWDDAKIRLRRGALGVTVASAPQFPPPSVGFAPPPATTAAAEPDASLQVIKSPTVGTFFAASSPEAGSYVKVGSVVNAETVVCMIEAMKVFNEITAGLSGTVVEILVENQSPVEFGQPLFRVKAG